MFVLCHDSMSCAVAQNAFPFSWAFVFNITQTIYMESGFFMDFYPTIDRLFSFNDYVGVVTYKARWRANIPNNIDTIVCQQNADAYRLSFSDQVSVLENLPVLQHAQNYHQGPFLKCWNLLFQAFGGASQEDYNSAILPPIYFSYWIARPRIFRQYCDFAITMRKIIETHELVKSCMDTATIYHGDRPQHLFPYAFSHHPFIFERLIPAFVFIHRHAIKLGVV
jgi:hypothetical protein